MPGNLVLGSFFAVDFSIVFQEKNEFSMRMSYVEDRRLLYTKMSMISRFSCLLGS